MNGQYCKKCMRYIICITHKYWIHEYYTHDMDININFDCTAPRLHRVHLELCKKCSNSSPRRSWHSLKNRHCQVYPCPSKTVSASSGAGWRAGHASAVPVWEKAMWPRRTFSQDQGTLQTNAALEGLVPIQVAVHGVLICFNGILMGIVRWLSHMILRSSS